MAKSNLLSFSMTLLPLLAIAPLSACTEQGKTDPRATEADVEAETAPVAASDNAAPGADASAAKASKTVFTTKQVFQGMALGGLAGADAICNQAAAAALPALPGTFKAWLSDAGTSAASRLAHAHQAYRLRNRSAVGILVAANFNDLISGSLKHEIDRDENGDPVAFSFADTSSQVVWTDTLTNGNAFPFDPTNPNTTENPHLDCNGWTSDQGAVGMTGGLNNPDAAWTQTGAGSTCDESAHLYCIEQ